jgi:SAM-dependent methyltransferase
LVAPAGCPRFSTKPGRTTCSGRPVTDRRYTILRCPTCESSLVAEAISCSGCGRRLRTVTGCLDLLDDQARIEADQFVSLYRALRIVEGWADAQGRENPELGKPQLWQGRIQSVERATATLGGLSEGGMRPVIVDVGSGGGWAVRYLSHSDVIALDLIDVVAEPAIGVRGDMRRLPIRDAAIDGMLFAASLHYAPVSEVVPEIARVLRIGGIMVAVDSPIYGTPRLQQRARSRSAEYYARAGFPQLIDRYHPVESGELLRELRDHGLRIIRLDSGREAHVLWRRKSNQPPGTLVIAEKVG